MLLTSVTLALVFTVFSQDKPVWKNKKCAVVLTYDDALNVHLDNVIPLLDSLGLKGTFFLSGYSQGFSQRIKDWKKAAAGGHEMANHTLYHPCIGKRPGREWVQPDYDMTNYTLKRMRDEIKMTNTLLQTLDGKTKRTFAYPCGDTKIGDSLYLEKSEFAAARGVADGMLKINEIDLYNVNCYGINGQSGDQLVELVKKAMETNSLLVFLFHGVGGEHSINVSLEAHRKLLLFLKENQKDIWIPTFLQMAEYVKNYHDQGK